MLSWIHIAPPKPLCSWVVKCMQISCCFILQLKCCTAEQQKVFWKFSGEKLAILQCSLAHISAAKQVLCCCVTSCCVKTQEKLCCRAERETCAAAAAHSHAVHYLSILTHNFSTAAVALRLSHSWWTKISYTQNRHCSTVGTVHQCSGQLPDTQRSSAAASNGRGRLTEFRDENPSKTIKPSYFKRTLCSNEDPKWDANGCEICVMPTFITMIIFFVTNTVTLEIFWNVSFC